VNTENEQKKDLGPVITRRRIINLTGWAIADLLISLWMGQQAYRWMPPQASAESVLVDQLFSFMTTLGCFIFLGVVGTLLYSILFHRAAKYDASDGPAIEGNLTLEIVWTAIPIALVIWIGAVSYQTYDRMSILGPIAPKPMATVATTVATVPFEPERQAASSSAVTPPTATLPPTAPIEVHARQWAWEFRYPEQGISSTELHLPVNQRAQFKLTSEDVLHGFFVPAFRVKQDIIPGREIDFSLTPIREGRYRLRDSEYSGTYFAANQANVVVESAQSYAQWLADASTSKRQPAENVAAQEFAALQGFNRFRWETVTPAQAPLVNHSSSEEDSHE
jgi:cytochrome c oxidase subunit II